MLKQRYGTVMLLVILVATMPNSDLNQPDDAMAPTGQNLGNSAWFDEPICYLKTASGQMINLRLLCENKLGASAKSAFPLQGASGGLQLRSGAGYEEDARMDDR